MASQGTPTASKSLKGSKKKSSGTRSVTNHKAGKSQAPRHHANQRWNYTLVIETDGEHGPITQETFVGTTRADALAHARLSARLNSGSQAKIYVIRKAPSGTRSAWRWSPSADSGWSNGYGKGFKVAK